MEEQKTKGNPNFEKECIDFWIKHNPEVNAEWARKHTVVACVDRGKYQWGVNINTADKQGTEEFWDALTAAEIRRTKQKHHD